MMVLLVVVCSFSVCWFWILLNMVSVGVIFVGVVGMIFMVNMCLCCGGVCGFWDMCFWIVLWIKFLVNIKSVIVMLSKNSLVRFCFRNCMLFFFCVFILLW